MFLLCLMKISFIEPSIAFKKNIEAPKGGSDTCRRLGSRFLLKQCWSILRDHGKIQFDFISPA